MPDGGQQYPARILFDSRPVMDDRLLKDHIKRAIRYGLTGVINADSDTCRVIANGPSALQAPLTGTTLALNGALAMMLSRGVKPTYWAACDPQELVADFLIDAPVETTYLVASKCHPKVFERLLYRDVCVWHLDDIDGMPGTPHTSTVTVSAMNMMRERGWKKFEVWGWDGCYLNGRHHASETHSQKGEGLPDDWVECEVNGRKFLSRHAWACEAHEAQFVLMDADYKVKVMGDGMVAEFLKN